MESDHGLEKILGVGSELEFKSMKPDWIRTPKKVTPLISGKYAVVLYVEFTNLQINSTYNCALSC